jgi:beta-galactosidase
VYAPGELRVMTWKNGQRWAGDTVKTAGEPARLELSAEKIYIGGPGQDLGFIAVRVLDKKGIPAPVAGNTIQFKISGPGEIVCTDNGDPADLVAFPSKERKAFNGMALAIIRATTASGGTIIITAVSKGLQQAKLTLFSLPTKHE